MPPSHIVTEIPNMRFLVFLFLVGCQPTDTKPGLDSTDSTQDSDSSVDGSTDSSTDSRIDTADSDTADTADTEPCNGVRLLQVVYYPIGTIIYDIAAVPGGFAVSIPTDGSAGSGLVESWTLDQGDFLEREYDEPAAIAEGPDARQYLGVQLFAGPDDRLCSQTYGDSLSGVLYCWPAEESGTVDAISTTVIYGENNSYFGYGYGNDSDVWAWDAQAPGEVVGTDGSNWDGICGDDTYCHSGVEQDGVFAATSENTGNVYGYDGETGEPLWEVNVEGDYIPAYVWAHYIGYVMAVGGDPDGIYFRVIDISTGSVLWEGDDYAAGFELGVTSKTDLDVEVLTYYHAQEDGSIGGIYVYGSDGTTLVQSFAELLEYESPTDWDEPFIRLVALDEPGLFAFATRRGNVAGVFEVCSTEGADRSGSSARSTLPRTFGGLRDPAGPGHRIPAAEFIDMPDQLHLPVP